MCSNNTVYVVITAGVITGGILVGIAAGILSEQGCMRTTQGTELLVYRCVVFGLRTRTHISESITKTYRRV
jgi:hypothetical protein